MSFEPVMTLDAKWLPFVGGQTRRAVRRMISMTLIRVIFASLAGLAFAMPAAAAPLRASLEPAKGDSSARPFAMAVLAVENGLGKPIAAAALKPVQGGPTVLTELLVPPGSRAQYRIALPAAEAHQEYQIRLLDAYDDGRAPTPPTVLAETQASIDWPLETVTSSGLISPQAYAAVGSTAVGWPASLRQQALIALASFLLLTGFCLLLPWRIGRLMGTLAAVAAGGGLLWWLSNSPAAAAVESTTGHITQRNADGRILRETILRLSARRTAAFAGDLDDLRPLYQDALAFQHDRSILRLGSARQKTPALSTVPLSSGQVRLFAGLPPPGRSAAAPVQISASQDVNAGQWVLTAGRAVPPAVLLMGDRFTPVEALATGRPQTVKISPGQPLGLLRQSPGDFGFDPQAMPLFAWWDLLHRRVDKTYLVWATIQGEQMDLEAVELK
jgi:hypothetical protein